MASHEAYLRTSLSRYQHADTTKRDILNTIATYKDLRPRLDNFVFNDGKKKELMCLDGTIPVQYKGTQYNIPVCLWLLDTHPYNPPMAYVKPTSTMMIKPGRHVDNNGRVYLPYLHEWKYEPPVFAKSSAAPARPAYPPAQRGATPSLPYPVQGSGMPVPSYPSSTTSGYPPAGGGGYPPTSTYSGYPGYPPATQNPPTSTTAGGMYPPGPPRPPGPPAQQQQQPQQYPNYPAYNPQTNSYQTNAAGSTNTVSNEQIRASLLTAVEEKLKRRLNEIFAQGQAEMDVLKKTSEDLQSGRERLDDMMNKLQLEQNEVERNITLLREKEEEMKAVLSKLEGREQVGIDEVVVPATPLYKQLLNAFAEEQATEDTIYYLGEGLRRGAIDLDVFLKQVRELSRRQFMLRAMVHRCRQTAGLPDLRG